jgi:hypothetical protein
MSRELNKELFGSRSTPTAESQPIRRPGVPLAIEFEVREEDWRLLKSQVDYLKKKNQEIESKLEVMQTKNNELLQSAKTRIERLGAATQRLEEAGKLKFQDVASKMSALVSKVTERKASDTKIEEMISRHNQAIQAFELRTQQLQKLISEQEMQLMNHRSALLEAHRELTRLKR